jgi:hypothetical protein
MKKITRLGKRQKGISTPGIITVIGIFGVFVVAFFKLFPMYYDNIKLQSVLERIQQDSSVDAKSKRAIWESMKKRLYVDEVRVINRENVVMERKDGRTTVTVTYETRDAFIGNLFIGASFIESVVIDR